MLKMFKILSVVALFSMCLSASAFFDVNQLNTKDIVRAKLWYQGVELESKEQSQNQIQSQNSFESVELDEEVSVAIELLMKNS